MVDRTKGKPVDMKLAGGRIIQGAMTQYGEVMPPPPDRGAGTGWILPVQRLIKELGMELVWNVDQTYLKYPDGRKIVLFLEQGLPFMWFKDFTDLRFALGKSHLTGRKQHEKEEVKVNNILTTVTEDMATLHEGWSTWVEGDVREEDEVFLGTMSCTDGKDVVSPALKERCQWDIHQRGCPKCRKAIGMMRPHRKERSTSRNVLSCDLSGPHPEAIGTKYKYLMVAVLNTGSGGVNLPFVRGLETKSAMSVTRAVSNVIAEVNSMMGMPIVCRFHSDAGSEFWNKEMSQMLDGMGIFQTKTTGYDPQANGRAERHVGWIKRHAASYLVHAGFGLKFRYWALQQAAFFVSMPSFGGQVAGERTHVREQSVGGSATSRCARLGRNGKGGFVSMLGQFFDTGSICGSTKTIWWNEYHYCSMSYTMAGK